MLPESDDLSRYRVSLSAVPAGGHRFGATILRYLPIHALASFWQMARVRRQSAPASPAFKRKSHGHPAHRCRHRRQPSQGEFFAQDRQRAGQARARYAQARRRHPARHFVFQSGPGSRTAGRLAEIPRDAAEVERRAVRHARIQSLDPRRAEERHRRRIAALRQELVPRQADRHRQQFAGSAGRRQRRQAPAEYPAGHFAARSWGSRKST